MSGSGDKLGETSSSAPTPPSSDCESKVSKDSRTDIHVSDAEKVGEADDLGHADTISNGQSCYPNVPDGPDRTILQFKENDPDNPYCWSRPKKLFVVATSVTMVMNSTIGSSIAAGGTEVMARRFHLQSEELLVLPTSIYLVGYVLGPMVFPPLSEQYGRKVVVVATFALFTAFVLGCALSPNYVSFIIFRLLVGIGASTPISVIGGIFADLYNTPKARGLAVTGFMTATTWGPVVGPIISGYIAPISWPWVYWTELIIAGATWPLLLLVPETFGPVILKRKAKKMRRAGADVVAPADLEERDLRNLLVVVLARPVRMFLTESIVFFACLYLSLVYGIFFIFLQAYPIVFQGIYGFSDGEEGLAFLPIGVGALIASACYLGWNRFLDSAKARKSPPAWASNQEYLRLPLACFGGPMLVISMFWLGWTARTSVPWIVPVLSALPFGIGFLLIFMSLVNYLVDAYEVYAASAMGAASFSRSIFGVVLPFAARPMYDRLGVAWACTLLALLSAVMIIIPFVFIRYGPAIRARSKFCQQLLQAKQERERDEVERREERKKSLPPDPARQV